MSTSWNEWSTYAPFVIPPVAAAVAIQPVLHGFSVKSALQAGKIPPIWSLQRQRASTKLGATFGVAAGVQFAAQSYVEKYLSKPSESNGLKAESNGLKALFGSAAIVGFVSAAPLMVFNAQTQDMKVMDALGQYTFTQLSKQFAATTAREILFITSIRMQEPIAKEFKKRYGDHKVVEYAASFFSVAACSILNHPADTALTVWQAKERFLWRNSMRGVAVRSVSAGLFGVLYHLIKDSMK